MNGNVLTPAKKQSDIYDYEIAEIQKEIDEIILLKEASYKKCEALIKEIEQLNKELSDHVQVIDDNIDLIANVKKSIDLNKHSILEKKKELQSLQKEIDDIVDANSVGINFFRDKIQNASVIKFILIDMLERQQEEN